MPNESISSAGPAILGAIKTCPCCAGNAFKFSPALWPELIEEWQLSPAEADYTNRQQGFCCKSCGCNLRSMTLARALLGAFGFGGTLSDFTLDSQHRSLNILELNGAGQLTQFFDGKFAPKTHNSSPSSVKDILRQVPGMWRIVPPAARRRKVIPMPGHVTGEYPEVDMTKLPYANASFDVVLHSDTLEHVSDPLLGLKECRRVLRRGGFLCFTIPIIVDRSTMSRAGMPASYHGIPGSANGADLKVWTEYGADFWKQMFEAGFFEFRAVSLEYPSSIAIVGVG